MIYVDDRVGAVEIAPYISAPKTVTRLDAGDFMFLGNGPDGVVSVGIERKRIKDLLSSLSTGRLSGHQLVKMTQSFHYSYLLVEEPIRMSKGGIIEYRKGKAITLGSRTFTYREVAKFLNTLSIMCGVRIWMTRNMMETGAWISYMFNWWAKEWDKHSAHQQFQEEPTFQLVKPSFIRRVIRELGGVREVRGEAIAKKFNTLEKLMAASVKDFTDVPGVGKKTAESIWKELHNG